MEIRENIISILVNNKPDVLARIAGTFSGRGFNIESISANVTMNPDITKIIITTRGNKQTVTRMEKQLNKLVDVLRVDDLTDVDSARGEMILIRIKLTEENKNKVMKAINTYNWRVVIVDPSSCIVEVTGDKDIIDDALAFLAPLGMDDFTRTGSVVLKRCKS
jgi:acetolactate synthase-1/3 small subunit